jgi:DNA-binding transcriptional LysR family regulator
LYAWEFEKDGRELKVRVEGELVFNGTFQMLNAALAGFGLAYVPEDVAQPHIAKGRLKRVLEDWCPRHIAQMTGDVVAGESDRFVSLDEVCRTCEA